MKYRGKPYSKENFGFKDGFVYGYYWTNELGNHFIRIIKDGFGNFGIEDVEINEKTLGQNTGLTDINGIELYVGDKCLLNDDWKKTTPLIIKQDTSGHFMINYGDLEMLANKIIKIGTIHDV